jgi:hypothetical protein
MFGYLYILNLGIDEYKSSIHGCHSDEMGSTFQSVTVAIILALRVFKQRHA